jgi:hypothetical protein
MRSRCCGGSCGARDRRWHRVLFKPQRHGPRSSPGRRDSGSGKRPTRRSPSRCR